MTSLLDRVPASIRSLWNAEVELRRGLWASVLSRGEPNPHYDEARRHWNKAISTRRPVSEKSGEWGSAEHVAATVEQDEIDEATKKPSDPDNAPRF